MPDQVSVLVAGGGPVGLTLGVLLGRLGIGCVVAERRSGTSLLPRATGVNVRSMEIFRALGLEDSIRAVSLAGDGIPFLLVGETLTSPPRARVESEQYLSAMPAGWPSPTQALWCAQDQLEPLLLEAARSQESTTVVFDTELVSFTAGDRVRADLRDVRTGEVRTVEADYLVGADGPRSTVRRLSGIGTSGHPAFADELTILFRADLEPALHGRRFFLYRVENGEVSGIMRPAGASGRWLFGTPVTADTTPERCVALIRAAVGDPGLDVEIIATGAWEAAALVADDFVRGRVVLAGDAAHQHTPGGGFGLNSGIQDAHNLAWKLAAIVDRWAAPGLLSSYQAERRPLAQLTTELSVARLQGGVAKSARTLGAVLGARYDTGAFVADGSPPPPPVADPVTDYQPCARPGHRAPHVWLDASHTTAMLDLFTGGFVLLTSAPASWRAAVTAAARSGVPIRLEDPPVPGWIDAYGVGSDGAVLVRPDGYVAARWPVPPRQPALAHALSVILRPG